MVPRVKLPAPGAIPIAHLTACAIDTARAAPQEQTHVKKNNQTPQNKISARLAALLLAASGLAIGHLGPAAAQACAPGTCCATNPTTGTPACGAAAGNPLNVMSGNKFQREVDMPA